MLVSTKHAGSGLALMQILALPHPPSYVDASRAKDLVELRQRRLPLISLPHESGEIVPHKLIDGSVAVDSHLPRRAEQLFVQGQSQIFCHRISVARNT